MIDIAKTIIDWKASGIKSWPVNTNRASLIGYWVPELEGCLRRGVYERTRWQDKELYPIEAKLRFDEGNNQERAVLQDMANAGVEIIEQQRPYMWIEKNISGHIDGKLLDKDEKRPIPIEIKSMAPVIFARIHTFEDFKKYPWTRAYMAQITLYMIMENIDKAIFILKDKSSGMLRQINLGLDYELGEYCIRTAEKVENCVRTGLLPDRITNRETCKDCPFKLLCLPDIDFGAPLRINDDPEYEQKLDKWMAVKDSVADGKKLWTVIASEAKAQAAGDELNLVVGKYRLTAKKAAQFRLNVEKIGD